MSKTKIGIIGLDTSHTIEFTRIMQGDAPAENKIEGMQVAKAMRFPSPFQSEKDQGARQAQLEKWGVQMVESVAEVVDASDAILLEINDPALHLKYFEEVAACGKPIFLDKPLAGSLADGKKIIELAKANNTNAWGASSLRFSKELVAILQDAATPMLCNTFGALGKAAAGSDVVWYGCHAVEMMTTIMGTGAESVYTREDDRGVVIIAQYPEMRRGVVECNRQAGAYGGRVQFADGAKSFGTENDVFYYNILLQIQSWLAGGKVPVALDEMLEVQAILDAAERSLASGKEESLDL